jgi:hypothetical protein
MREPFRASWMGGTSTLPLPKGAHFRGEWALSGEKSPTVFTPSRLAR